MEKIITFTNEQKSLIWKRFVNPANGSEEEAKHFIEVCETFGLNPLLGDIVFQKYETRQGPKVNFITTRDGMLRVAMNTPDYVGAPIGATVREGDTFEIDAANAAVTHKFGAKRGKIIGAWARIEHRRFKPVAMFIDFEEFFNANAQSKQERGGSPIWDKLPSTMIHKVAEVFVLRRQFPLGGLYTAEELGMDELLNDSNDNQEGQNGTGETTIPSDPKTPPTPSTQQQNSNQQNNQLEETEKDVENTKSTDAVKNGQKKVEKNNTEKTEKPNKVEGEYQLMDYQSGVSPSGVAFAKIQAKNISTGEQILVLAKEEKEIDESLKIPQDKPFDMEYREENGYKFLKSISLKEGVA